MLPAVWLPGAKEDLADIIAYISRHSPNAAQHMRHLIEEGAVLHSPLNFHRCTGPVNVYRVRGKSLPILITASSTAPLEPAWKSSASSMSVATSPSPDRHPVDVAVTPQNLTLTPAI